MFGHLMRGELARLRYRRRAWGSMILMLVAGLLAPAVWMEGIAMPTEADITLAMDELVRMQNQGDCLDCTFRDLLGWPTFDVVVRNNLSAAGIAFAFLTFMVVVAYVGADFSSGAISTQLTFTPRRSLVLATRALACGVLGALLMAVGLLTTTGVTVVGYLATNGVDSIGEASGLLRLLGGASSTAGCWVSSRRW
ncbi:hypothetical protein G7085_13235 [Tessaracoccus sp. HDW20]|uniref:ABC transporter permease subunit n=1 Tax=Tessaracoccus coleopterorum TaxID=2714950 RepID=UPI0018D3B683|nr:ABC transporter permease subunit [Tessaracoccus coleopterorum]NHB85272.1 hypothetical protein [Tessaracoccus coleopterorum]